MPPKICPVNHLLLLQPKMQRKNIMGLCSKMKKWKAMVKKCDIFNEFMAEFLGTFILILFGCGSVAQAVVTRGALGNLLTINMGFSLGVMLAVYVAGGVSGAHVNPAVSLAMMILKRLPPEKFPLYLVAQFLGAFAGASVVYGLYYDALMAYTNGVFVVTGPSATAQIFASYPDKSTSVLSSWHSRSDCGHPGRHGREEQWRSKRPATSGHQPDHHGHRSVHGYEWLSHQPSSRPQPTGPHGSDWLGPGCVQ
ncbi:aquaporin-9-like isoform X5 [Paralichthys olivaceus]